ncbi:MAG TPA: response regulator [Kofleriaceae bacterium]
MMATRRVLLVDDNDDQRSLLANALRARGWSVHIARNGKQGVDTAQRVQPEIVLTELILPDVRGLDYARSLRSMVEHDLLVIALTRVPPELHGRALASGYDHVHRKPFNADDLHQHMVTCALRVQRAS